MIALLGLVLTSLLVSGGGFVENGQMVLGLICIGIGSMGFGLLIAVLRTTARNLALAPGLEMADGLTVKALLLYLSEREDDNTVVYVGDQGINVASGVFSCLLDGRRALVIERKAE